MAGVRTNLQYVHRFDAIEGAKYLIATAMSGADVTSNIGAGPSRQPQKPPVKKPPVVTPGSGSNIIVSQRQASAPKAVIFL